MVLLERDADLEALDAALERAVRGTGSMVVVGGEAGIGKTALVKAFRERHEGRIPVLWGGCDDLSTPRAFGPFRDIALDTGGLLKERLATTAPRGDVLDAIYELMDHGRPATVAVIEDVHWADGATLDVLKFLGRRIDRMRTVLVVTYRSDEVGPDHPLRLVVGDLPPESVRRIDPAPLSPEAVASLAVGYDGALTELYEATGGNPFLVSQATSLPGASPGAAIGDAVRSRVSRLSAPARRLAELVAVVPTHVERRLLDRLGLPSAGTLEECRRRGLLEFDDARVWYRHELVRTAMRDSLTEERRRTLNQAILREVIDGDGDVSRIVHHALQAGDGDVLARFAPVAARQASAAASHREAISHYRLAARYADRLGERERADLLTGYAIECYLGGEVGEALDVSQLALDLWRHLGDRERQGDLLRWRSRFLWWLGRAADAERSGREAVEILESVPDSAALGMAYSTLAQLAMLAQDFGPAVRWSTAAIGVARARRDHATLAHALNNLGSARVRVGDLDGYHLLEESLAIALEHGLDDDAGRAYANLIWTALDYRRYDLAERYLDEGIAFAVRRDLGGSLHYMTSERAWLRLERGDWSGAEDDVHWVLDRPEEPGITHMPAMAIRARLAVRRGDPDARTALDEAWALAEGTGELQRMAPVAAARAELGWLDGDMVAAAEAIRTVYGLAATAGQPWVADELGFWLWRSGDTAVQIDPTTPFGLQAAGNWEAAAAAWDDIGCPYERAVALLDSTRPDDLLTALDLLDGLGARPAAALVRRELRRRGVHRIPRGPRKQTRENPAGLTRRQLEVLRLMAEGLTNAEIAGRLFLSPKTVDHHVSAVLGKLEVASRREAARRAAELGLVAP